MSMSERDVNDAEIEWWISRSTKNRLKIQITSRYMSDPTPSDIDFKNVWTTLKLLDDCYASLENQIVNFCNHNFTIL